MIKIRRSGPPVCFANSNLREAQLEHIKNWLGRPGGGDDRRHFALRSANEIPGFMEELRKLFSDKCAFCETKVTHEPDDLLLAFFRPIEGAIQTDGIGDRDHYGWLLWEWSNLYLACQTCTRQKGKSFPTRNPRSAPGTYGDGLLREEPLLLDPCQDDPDSHLSFDELGFVYADDGSDRGEATIRILNLNRDALVRLRKSKIHELRELLNLCLHDEMLVSRETAALIVQACRDESPFAAVARHLLVVWLQELTLPGDFVRLGLDNIKPCLSLRTESHVPDVHSDEECAMTLKQCLDSVRASATYRAFLSLDLKGSTDMKIEPGPVHTNDSFASFWSFVREVLEANRVLDFIYAGDGGMSRFQHAQEAIDAAVHLLRELSNFNRDSNQLPTQFVVRSGIHWGKVYWPTKSIADTFSPAADFAGHLQKEAPPNGLLISDAAYEETSNQDDFRLSLKKVDGKNAWEYVQPPQ